ncbi:hypothetical protein [Nocardia sp. AG03]|uniref:DUF7144 family membrane protein n=1 Tax=Nocardia sp. AG03 TaxID=3025312 RepID=UPI0024181879|nr:hypothetical protein [Nocardia sp. AG03]
MTPARSAPHPVRQGFAGGITMLIVVLLLVSSTLSILRGIALIAGDQLARVPDYSYSLDRTTWGWIDVALGVLGVCVSVGLILSATWAQALTIAVVALSIIGSFLSLPYHPWWSVIVIALDVIVIWAVSSWQPYHF